MISINLVNINGRLIGKSFSDRWNMEMLGYTTPIIHCRHSAALKRIRRANTDFAFSIVKGDMQAITPTEHAMLSPAYAKVA